MLKIATWNVMKATSDKRLAEIQKYVLEQQADVWVFTEVSKALIDRLNFKCSYTSSEGCDDGTPKGHYWTAICSDHCLESLPVSDPKRTAAVRVHPDNEVSFVVFGTVLPWFRDKWCGYESAGGFAFKAALDVQAGDWKCLREKYPDDEFFVAGDFNQDLVDQSPRYYGSMTNCNALENALKANALVALTGGKNDPVRRDSNPYACIDHICGRFDSKWDVRKTTRWPREAKPQRWLSDHFGVAAELVRKA